MVNCQPRNLDGLFSALADPTRRGILAALCDGSVAVSDLAEPFGMSLPGFTKHLQILEQAGLVRREKTGRVVQCTLAAAPLQPAAEWLSRYQEYWTARLDALAQFLNPEENPKWPPKKSPRRSRSYGSSKARRTKSGTPGPRARR